MIIGIGYGASQSHYTRTPFWKVKIENTNIKGKVCEECGKVQVFGKSRFCADCAKKRKRAYNRAYMAKTSKKSKRAV